MRENDTIKDGEKIFNYLSYLIWSTRKTTGEFMRKKSTLLCIIDATGIGAARKVLMINYESS